MATLYVSEYRYIAYVPLADSNVPTAGQAPQEPPVAEQTVSIAGSSTASQPFGGYTRLVRVHTDAICSIAFSTVAQVAIGTSPTAATTSKRLVAGQTEYFGVFPQQQIAVIANV